MYENFGVKFILFTFGDSEDEKYCSKLNFVNVIPVYKYIKKEVKNRRYNFYDFQIKENFK